MTNFSIRVSNQLKKLSVLLVLISIALYTVPASAQVIDEYSGEETFMRYCAACHGETGVGDGSVARGLPITVPDLT